MNKISPDSDEEINRILQNKYSKNTKRGTKNAILAFHAPLKDVENAEKGILMTFKKVKYKFSLSFTSFTS